MTTRKERRGLLALVLAFAAVGVGQGQVTYVGITNLPLAGRDVTLTIAGLSFATTDVSPTVLFGEESAGHVCATTAWSSNTAVQCNTASFPTPVYVPKNNAGRVLVRATGLSISSQGNNPLAYLSFDGPVITFNTATAGASNAVISAAVPVTISGLNFAATDRSPSFRLTADSSVQCATTSWTSVTALACSPSQHYASSQGGLILTIENAIGSATASFTFDAPAASYVLQLDSTSAQLNYASTAGERVTISGVNFGFANASPSVRLGSDLPCGTASWSSGTSVMCGRSPATPVLGGRVVATVASVVGTASFAITFDAPVVSFSSNLNGPTSGLVRVTIGGIAFGLSDLTLTASLPAEVWSTTWTSGTSVVVPQPIPVASVPTAPRALTLTVSTILGTATRPLAFSFDAPVVSSTREPGNGPLTLGLSLTLRGQNFGMTDATASWAAYDSEGKLSLGVATVSWSSDTTMRVFIADNVYNVYKVARRVVTLTVAAIVGTGSPGVGFTFDPPFATVVETVNGPASGGTPVTLLGFNFGAAVDPTASVLLAFQYGPSGAYPAAMCLTTSWTTNTIVTCAAPLGTQRDVRISTAFDGVGFTTAMVFTYDAPAITSIYQANVPASTGLVVTISGLNFGQYDTTPETAVGTVTQMTTAWTSATTVYVQWPTSCTDCVGAAKSASLRLNSDFGFGQRMTGVAPFAFTFDAPVVSSVGYPGNAPTVNKMSNAQGFFLTVLGFNFGIASSTGTPTVRLGFTACETTSWKTATSLACTPSAGTGLNSVTVQVASVVGTSLATLVSFNAPVVTSNAAYNVNGPMAGGWSLTIGGQNFAPFDPSLTASLNGLNNLCTTVSWVSSSSARCQVPALADISRGFFASSGTAILTVSSVIGTAFSFVTFDGPVLTAASPVNGPQSVGGSLTLLGSNFGNYDLTATSGLAGFSSCITTSWNTHTFLSCGIAAAQFPAAGSARSPAVTVGSSWSIGTALAAFSYDQAIVTYIGNVNAAGSGGTTMTLSGLNFAVGDCSATALFEGWTAVSPATTSWTSSTSVLAWNFVGHPRPAIPNSDADLSTPRMTGLMFSANVGTALGLFTFDSPAVTAYRQNAAGTGRTLVTITGLAFHHVDRSATFVYSSTRCTTTSWTSSTTLVCAAAAGAGQQGAVLSTLLISTRIGTALSMVTYDAPVSSFAPTNTPGCAGVGVTLTGLSFGVADYTSSATIGLTSCLSASWSSATSVACSAATGSGGSAYIGVAVLAIVGTLSPNGLTYDAPVVTLVTRNIPTSWPLAVSISGVNFGQTPLSATASLSATACASTTWVSVTQLTCYSAGGAWAGFTWNALTISGIVGTGFNLFSYDAAVITAADTPNTPPSGGASITIVGLNFGPFDLSVTANAPLNPQHTPPGGCLTSSWSSDSMVVCETNVHTYSAKNDGRNAILTVAALTGTSPAFVSFDAPVATFVSPANAPAGGRVEHGVTVAGLNFAGVDLTATARIAHIGTMTTSWTSATTLLVQTATGANGAAADVVVSLVASRVGTLRSAFTFDAPVPTDSRVYNSPMTGGAVVTISGANFASYSPTASVLLGMTSCATITWTTSTSLSCRVPIGSGLQLSLFVTIANLIGSSSLALSFDAPVITSVSPRNSATSMGLALTVAGLNLGPMSDVSGTVSLGSPVCITSSWVSATSFACTPQSGAGTAQLVALTVSASVGTLSAAFTFDAPVSTSIFRPNFPTTAGTSLTLAGLNFGKQDWTATVRTATDGWTLDGSAPSSTSWVTDSSVVFFLQGAPEVRVGAGRLNPHHAVTVGSVVGTGRFKGLTFDAPVSTFVAPVNTPPSLLPSLAEATITVNGINFAPKDATLTLVLSLTAGCLTTSWTSDTQVSCAPSRRGDGTELAVSIGSAIYYTLGFSYDNPVITGVIGGNFPASAGASVTINGINFGAVSTSLTAFLGNTGCPTSSWTASTSLICRSTPGSNNGLAASVIAYGLVGTGLSLLSFDAPAVSFLPPNLPTGPYLGVSATMTLTGLQFGSNENLSPTVQLGATLCTTTRWVSDTQVVCQAPLGQGLSTVPVLSVASNVQSYSGQFSYDAPVVTYVGPFNAPASSSFTISVSGLNYANVDQSPSAIVGATACLTTSWSSTTSLGCLSGLGTGVARTIIISLEGVVGTRNAGFTYDAAVPTSASPLNTQRTSAQSITVSGINFGSVDLALSVRHANQAYPPGSAIQWVSSTSFIVQSQAHGNAMAVTIDGIVGCASFPFSFDSPVLSATATPGGNMPISGGSSLTFFGLNFGTTDHSPSLNLASAFRALTATWTTDTSVLGSSPLFTQASSLSAVAVTLTVSRSVGSLAATFTFDAPVASQIIHPGEPGTGSLRFFGNGPTSGMPTSVTLRGMNFGGYDPTLSAGLGSTACSSVSWTSMSAVRCAVPAGTGSSLTMVFTVSLLVGTAGMIGFTYDAPVLTGASAYNTPGSGALLTLSGVNFAVVDATASASIGVSQCSTAGWTTLTSVRCMSPLGDGPSNSASVTVAGLVGYSATRYFTFDAPVATAFRNMNAAVTGGDTITVSGLNFGVTAMVSPTAGIDSATCQSLAWVSSTQLVCGTQQGLRGLLGVGRSAVTGNGVVTISILVGSLPLAYTFDAPILSSGFGSTANGPVSSGSMVTLAGSNFGMYSYSPSFALSWGDGTVVFVTASWTTATVVSLVTPSAPARSRLLSADLSLTISSLVNTWLQSFTFDGPVITAFTLAGNSNGQLAYQNVPTSGQTDLTLSGLNFHYDDRTMSALLGTGCPTSSWTSQTAVRCSLASGQGTAMAFVLQVSGLVGTSSPVITYDAPAVSFTSLNIPTSGGALLTVSGLNFASSDATASLQLGSSSCQTVAWTAGTTVSCSTPAGLQSTFSSMMALTISKVVATNPPGGFTFDAPLITSVQLPNTATVGTSLVTVQGLNLGAVAWTHTAGLGSTLCSTVSWSSSTAAVCATSGGLRTAQQLGIFVAGLVGTSPYMFTFDGPAITGFDSGNAAVTGGRSVSLIGVNFAPIDATLTGLLGSATCATAAWSSATAVTCQLGQSAVSDVSVANVIVASVVGTYGGQFTFDSPVVTQLVTPNSPPTGGSVLTLVGTNFATSDRSVSVLVGTTPCPTASWLTLSTVSCGIRPGFGKANLVALTVANLAGTTMVGPSVGGFTWDSPVITAAASYNSPVSAGVSVTVSGINFGTEDYSVTIQVGSTVCATSQWIGTTSVKCLVTAAGGGGSNLRLAITVGSGIATRTRSFSYDGPVVTVATNSNLPSTGGQTLTVLGANFAFSDASISVVIGRTLCSTTSWHAATSLLCASAPGGGSGLSLAVVIDAVPGTLLGRFSYDSPVPTGAVVYNGPVSSGSALTVSGNGFSYSDTSPTVLVGVTVCATTSWSSRTSLSCWVPTGFGASLDVTLTVEGAVGTLRSVFTFDAPVVTSIPFVPGFNQRNGPGTGGVSITLHGYNIGPVDATPSARLGLRACATTQWSALTSLTCGTPTVGFDQLLQVGLALNNVVGTLASVFSYDAPAVSLVTGVSNMPTSGDPVVRLTLAGTEFGALNLTPSTFVGKTRCQTTSWVSTTALLCSVGPGTGASLSTIVQLFSVAGTFSASITFDSPVISVRAATNTPTSGNAVITLSGANFGIEDTSTTSSLGPTFCATNVWVSPTTVVCSPSAGSGRDHHSLISISSLLGMFRFSVTFDAPSISAALQPNAPQTGSASITITGLNFAASAPTQSLTIALTSCSTTSWSSATSVGCLTASGFDSRHRVIFTVSAIVGTREQLFSFDTPVLSQSLPPNSATTYASSLTLSGLNFYFADHTSTLFVASRSCVTTSWTTSSSVTCLSQPVSYGTSSLILVDSVVGTAYRIFSFNAPAVSQVGVLNYPSTGFFPVTLSGLDFGASDLTVTAAFTRSPCATTGWTSTSTVVCAPSIQVGLDGMVAVVASGMVGTLANYFSFDAPVLPGSDPLNYRRADPFVPYILNLPTSGGVRLTFYGTNFAAVDATPSGMLGGPLGSTLCSTVSWSSASSIACLLGPGAGRELVASIVTATVPGGLIAGSTLPKFTYDSPVVTTVLGMINLPHRAQSYVTVSGQNFAPDDRSATIVLSSPGGHVTARTVSWSSSTSLIAYLMHSGDLTGSGLGRPSSSQQAYMSVTISGVVGTVNGLLTFDAPVITAQNFLNRPAWRTLPITADHYMLFGQNFGPVNLSPTASMTADSYSSSQYEVLSTSWLSDSQISTQWRINGEASFEYPAANRAYQITVSALVGTSSAPKFTFDSPILTGVAAASTYNAPVSGGGTVVLFGKNLGGQEDPTPALPTGYTPGFSNVARFGATACVTTSWTSGSAVMCAPQPGQGSGLTVTFTAGGVVGTSRNLFTYDAPVLSDFTPANLPTAGGAAVMLAGFNLGSMQSGSAVDSTVGSAVSAVYVSGTRVTLTSPALTRSKLVSLTLSGIVGTLAKPFSFDGPAIASVDPRNGVGSGRTLLTISGMSLWSADTTATAALSQTVCITTAWTSTSSVSCSLAPGSGSSLTAILTIVSSVGTSLSGFSFDSPVVTNSFIRNGVATGGGSVTILGLGFGTADPTLSTSIGSAMCRTTSWSSLTSALCMHAAASGLAFASTVTSQSLIGTLNSVFSFDSPVVSSATGQTNGPTSAGTTLTVSGINFGATQQSVLIGPTACSQTTFVANSQVQCVVAPGTGREMAVSLKQGVQSGTMLKVFSFDAPVVTSSSVSNGPAKAGVTVTLLGTNFGGPDSSPTVLVGQSVCSRSLWVSGSTLLCLTPGGFGLQPRLVAVISRQAGSFSTPFSFDAPMLTHVATINGPTDVSSAVLFLGLNLGSEDASPTVKLGGSLCSSVSWSADSSVTCYTRIGSGNNKALYYELGSQSANRVSVFTFDAPVITAMSTFNGPSNGNINTITLFGQNFGSVAGALSASIGATNSAPVSVVSTGVATCVVPGGSGQGLRVAVTLDSLVSGSTSVASFTYNPPTVTAISPRNVPYVLPARITLFGVNFVGGDTEVQVGGSVCSNSGAITPNRAFCVPARPTALFTAPLDVQVKTRSGVSTLPGSLYYNPPTNVTVQPGGTQPALNFSLASTDTIVLQIQSATIYDTYTIEGNVTFAGSLKLYLGQYRPSRTQLFPVFKVTGSPNTFQSGDFSSMTVADVAGATVTYSNKTAGLSVKFPGCESVAAPECSGHGTCNPTTGECNCTSGYGGNYCDTACFYNMATAAFDCTCPSTFLQAQPGVTSSADSHSPAP